MSTSSAPAARDPGLRRAVIGGLAVTLASVAFGLVAFIWLFLAQRTDSIPQLVGRDTQFYAALTPNLRQAPNITRLRAAFPELLDDTAPSPGGGQIDSLLGVDFSSEIAPWIGAEMALAVSDLNAETIPLDREELAERATALFIFASRDDPTALRFLDGYRAKREAAGQRLTTTQVGEATLYTQEGATDSLVASFGLVRHYVIFTNRPAALTALAERDPQSADTLQASPRFQRVQRGLPTDRIGYLYIDGPALDGLTRTLSGSGLAEQLPALKALEGFGLAVNLLAEGVQLHTLAAFDPAFLPGPAAKQLAEGRLPVDAARAGQVSREALALATFRLPAGLDKQLDTALATQPELAAQLSGLEQQLGFDVRRDLLAWLAGEGTLAVLPGETIGATSLPFTGYLALRPLDQHAAMIGVTAIVEAIVQTSGGQLVLEPTLVGGAGWQALVEPQAGTVLGGYGFVGEDLVLAVGARALLAASTGGQTPVGTELRYEQVTNGLPSPNGGLIYVDLARAFALADQDQAAPAALERLRPITALAAAGQPGIDNNGLARAQLLLILGE